MSFMRSFVVLIVVFASLVAPAFAAAPPSEPAPGVDSQTLDQLFATMANPDDKSAGKSAEAEIQRRWRKSGSDTVDLLMSWAADALAAKQYGQALDFLDSVVTLKPDFAEGWNRRATIFYLQDDYGKAIADLEKVLALQPRHFGALAGLGMILREISHDKEALTALEKAVDLDPYLDGDIQDVIKELKPTVDGQDI